MKKSNNIRKKINETKLVKNGDIISNKKKKQEQNQNKNKNKSISSNTNSDSLSSCLNINIKGNLVINSDTLNITINNNVINDGDGKDPVSDRCAIIDPRDPKNNITLDFFLFTFFELPVFKPTISGFTTERIRCFSRDDNLTRTEFKISFSARTTRELKTGSLIQLRLTQLAADIISESLTGTTEFKIDIGKLSGTTNYATFPPDNNFRTNVMGPGTIGEDTNVNFIIKLKVSIRG